MKPRLFSKAYLGVVLFVALAMYAATIAIALPPTIVFFAAAPLLLYTGYRSYRKLLRTADFRQAFIGVYVWLLILVVGLPNLCMSLLLYTDDTLPLVSFGLAIFAFVFASPYYWIPAALFGESLFLKETVVSPHGLGGILASAVIWAVILMLVLVPLALLADWRERH